jgi:hypothetical protein
MGRNIPAKNNKVHLSCILIRQENRIRDKQFFCKELAEYIILTPNSYAKRNFQSTRCTQRTH